MHIHAWGLGGCRVLRFIKTEGSNSCRRRREKLAGLYKENMGTSLAGKDMDYYTVSLLFGVHLCRAILWLPLACVCDRHTAGDDEGFGISLGWGWDEVEQGAFFLLEATACLTVGCVVLHL